MSALRPGWADRAGAEAGAIGRGNYAVTQPSARRPVGWRPGGIYNPTRGNLVRGGEKAKVSKRAERSLDAALGKAEGEE